MRLEDSLRLSIFATCQPQFQARRQRDVSLPFWDSSIRGRSDMRVMRVSGWTGVWSGSPWPPPSPTGVLESTGLSCSQPVFRSSRDGEDLSAT